MYSFTLFTRVLSLVVRELMMTESDYINSLDYIISNYIPELLSDDVMQPLRGKKNVIFGNIEKIYEFHSQVFLKKVEQCENSPFQLGACFLEHVSDCCWWMDLCLGFVKSNDCYGNVIVMPKSSVKLKLKNFYNSSEQPVRNPTDPKTWSILRLALQVEIMDKVFEIRSKCCAENWQNKLNWAATSETSKQRPWKCESPILFVYGAHLDVSQHPLSKCNIYLYEVWAWNRGWLVESDYYLNCEAKF